MHAGLQDHARLRRRDPPRPLPRHPRRPAADRPARQGRPARVRRELREGRGPGLLVLAARRRRRSTRGPSSCRPPASRPGARSSPRRRSAASAGWRTPPCSRASGSTASGATTSSSRATASRSARRSSGPAGGPSPTCRRTTGTGRRDRRSTTTTRSTTGATSAIAARSSRTPRCPTSTSCSALQRLELGEDRPPSGLRGGRPGVEPRAVDAHPAADRLERRRRRLGLQPHARRTSRTAALWSDPDRVRAAYGQSIEYTLNALFSFVQHYGDDEPRARRPRRPPALDDRHRAAPGHDVPISIIAHDPAVLRPDRRLGLGGRAAAQPDAPVWPMSAFRDRFLSAFGS